MQFGEAAGAVIWLHDVAAYAADKQEWDLLEGAVRSMWEWDGVWDQWYVQDKVGPWLRTLDGGAADVVASALRDHPDSAQHSLAWPMTGRSASVFARPCQQRS